MAKLKPILKNPFTNDHGDVINPGDPILSVTKCTGSAYAAKGIYLGYRIVREATKDRPQEISVCVEQQLYRRVFVHKVTGKEWDYNTMQKLGHKYPTRQWYSKTGIWDYITRTHGPGDPDADAKNAAEQTRYVDECAKYEAIEKQLKSDYHWVKIPYTRKTSLQLNKIYPLTLKVQLSNAP